jgi:competence protein ComEC
VVFQVYGVVIVSGMIQLGLALPMVVYFHRVGLSGLSANALVVPLMALVVPLGFAAIFTGWVWVAKLAGALLAASGMVADWHARLEPNWRVPTPPLWLAVALAVALILAGLRGARWLRVAGALAVATLTGILLVHPFAPAITPRQLEVTAIDVGQGDSLLVVSPQGRLMLVDGGGILAFGPRPRTSMDIGEDVVAPYLWNRSIRKIDVVVCTHAHDDHIGGLPALMTAFRVPELWTGATPESPQWEKLRATARARGARIVPLRAGQSLEWGGAHVDALAPEKDYQPGPVPRNNDSLVLRIAYRGQAFFLPGDVERPVEWSMLDGGRLEPTAVLKVAHHGSKTSTTEEFLGAVRPLFAVISAGFENSYGHPHADVLARLRERGVMVRRTDRDGLVTVRTDGRRITLDTARWQGTEPALRQVF